MIEIENLTKRFGDRTVLDDISLSVAAGEILAVVGPSGAGKSTLSRCVSFLERPTSGSVRVDGKDFTRLDGAELIAARRKIGVIFQTAPLLRRRTVAQNIALPLEYLRATDDSVTKRVAELLDRVGLADRSHYHPAQLSGGQRQRVGIARALALGPSVLLSDEATSGLDPATTRSILALLSHLREEFGLSIILITHEMEVVREIADSVARIDNGRIVESGSVTDVILDPGSALARELLPERPSVPLLGDGEVWEVSYASRDVPLDWLTSIQSVPGISDAQVSVLSASVEAIRGVAVGRAVLAISPGAPTGFAEYLTDRGLHVRISATARKAAA
ncbi:methionine ABC transporter ATP-binding protein [Mycolicibacterium litorale]|uniref:Methionine import ATP-binding protein MetN n=1 Tax=Mycolicibacterium litorale TaxID=758802 RepID=A0AAD1MQJ5_9MYCO|nr:ATP-binding cassette domain-containing protein [Mycolicibacterium litorale]MCV7413734.1 ATP-binding cassette domain-containing protein [Mycolicibacterium litorale]TDY03383.1 ABC-type methionine transport system ATPase subunit [Mycolicibacterium litorale]BBY15179.1 methionine import ATP-binding protein MetN [Mycolicibacterium litorale]